MHIEAKIEVEVQSYQLGYFTTSNAHEVVLKIKYRINKSLFRETITRGIGRANSEEGVLDILNKLSVSKIRDDAEQMITDHLIAKRKEATTTDRLHSKLKEFGNIRLNFDIKVGN